MARIFTIFNHGTGSHRSRTDGEIISVFGKEAKGQEYTDFLITDGPGSDLGDGGATRDTANPQPGTFDPYTRDKTEKSVAELEEAGFKVGLGVKTGLKDPAFMSMTKPSMARGLLTGRGWDDNVIHAIAAISELSPVPEVVNMIGWSRGAVTCAKMAYALADVYPQIGCNIFAIDPVAGTGNRSERDGSTLRENVRNYVATLAMHEQRGAFEPQDMSRVSVSKMTNAVFLPFPGKHDTSVKLRSTLGESAQVQWSLAFSFLTHFGTEFHSKIVPRFPGPELCNLYGRMRVAMSDYRALRQRWKNIGQAVQGGIARRDFMSRTDKYVIDADYFINEHHREVFIRTYPRVYRFLFEGQAGNERQVWEQFRSMYNLTGLMESLAIFGVEKPPPGHPFVLPPPGAGQKRGGMSQMGVRGNLVSMGVF